MTAEIIKFPIDAKLYHIRNTARILSLRNKESADRFWKMTCNRMYGQLQIEGVPRDKIPQELHNFQIAVLARLEQIQQEPRDSGAMVTILL